MIVVTLGVDLAKMSSFTVMSNIRTFIKTIK